MGLFKNLKKHQKMKLREKKQKQAEAGEGEEQQKHRAQYSELDRVEQGK